MNEFAIVYTAEVSRRIRSRAFIVGLLIGMIGIGLVLELPSWIEGAQTAQNAVVLAGPAQLTRTAKRLLSTDLTVAQVRTSVRPPTQPELDKLKAGRMIALTVVGGTLHVVVYSADPSNADSRRIARLLLPLSLSVALRIDDASAARASRTPIDIRSIGSKFASADSAAGAHALAFTLLFLLYMLVILNSQLTMSGVVEEKTSRIAELLVTSISAVSLLYGKIVAGVTLAIVQMICWVAVAIGVTSSQTSVSANGPFGVSGIAAWQGLSPLVFWAFAFFLIVGLLQYSTLFAGMGSLISRPEDLGSIGGALTLPIVAALLLAIAALGTPDATLFQVASFVPLIAPFVMFSRIAVGEPPVWQLVLCATINIAALWAIAIGAGRLYRVGMLLYGRMPTPKQIWATVRG
jgi:ABC-2 type transport system permease protein